ncbi:MAG: RNA polymerase factor sigma-54 [Bacteroidales bacterium]|nr:RNA polymerase factor sigma-54 [Bacteroidales bacterium]
MQKLQLQQKLQQRLTPQQILQIKLLEYTSLELEEKILQELEENPALEEGAELTENDSNSLDEFDNDNYGEEDFSLGDYLDEDDIPSYKLAEKQNQEDRSETFYLGDRESFHEELVKQLHLRDLSELETKVGEYIIGNIDSDGYLRRELNSISDDLLFQADIDISVKDLKEILNIIQDFDPAGVGAENLRDCLLLQLNKKEETPSILLAIQLLTQTFEEFTKKHYDKIANILKTTEEELKIAIHEITLLNPKPGNSVSDGVRADVYQIIPDFIVETIDEEIFTSLNNKNIPSLHVSRNYAEMLQDYSSNQANRNKENKAAVQFVKQKLDSAKWFIDALKQRQNTLTVTMEAIIDLQRGFFITGDESDLRPMILKDIAERTGLDISTISRVSNSKYVQTNYGVFALKYFFTDGMQTDSGEEVSTREIKNILREAIEAEEKRKPLTDEKLCEILNEKGYPLARRTVAKYREAMGIPVARLRKEI